MLQNSPQCTGGPSVKDEPYPAMEGGGKGRNPPPFLDITGTYKKGGSLQVSHMWKCSVSGNVLNKVVSC